MLSPKDKDDFINALCGQVKPNAHFNINKPSMEYLIFLHGLKEQHLLNYFSEHHSVVYLELNYKLYTLMEAGGFTRMEDEKKDGKMTISRQTDEIFHFYKKNSLNKYRIDWQIEAFLPTIGLEYHGIDYDQMVDFFCQVGITDETGNGLIFTRLGKMAIENFDYYSDFKRFVDSSEEEEIKNDEEF